jgi:ribosomal protein S18 acetylase RimI-like enzyme
MISGDSGWSFAVVQVLEEDSMSAVMTYQIRPVAGEERESVQRMWAATGMAQAAPDEWDALLTNETSAVLVAEEDGRVIGSAVAVFYGWRAYIYHVAVVPERRQEGLAHALLQEAERYLLSAGARHVFVAVHEANTEGLALVGSAGYLPDGEIVLSKRLATRIT